MGAVVVEEGVRESRAFAAAAPRLAERWTLFSTLDAERKL